MKLLPYQLEIRNLLFPTLPSNDSLLILAPGLGLRKVIVAFLQAQVELDSNNPAVEGGKTVIVNATESDIDGIREEVGLSLVDLDGLNGVEERYHAYLEESCKLIAVTSRVFITDLLTSKIPLNKLSGIVLLHAEEVTPNSTEAFIAKLYRDGNKTGFLKAFSDAPEAFTHGISPLQSVLRCMKLRKVLLWPRFHELVQTCLSTEHRVDVIELHQHLSANMDQIQTAIIECMDATLAEVRKATADVDPENLDMENALFRSFDSILRNYLDPVWNKISPRTRQLIGDLAMLRRLLRYLLSYDCVSFNTLIETIIQSNTTNQFTGNLRQNQSPWLFLQAAETIIQTSRRRVYERRDPVSQSLRKTQPREGTLLPDEDEEAAFEASVQTTEETDAHADLDWLPENVELILEEQPKWDELFLLIQEIEREIFLNQHGQSATSRNTILIMCSSASTCAALREYICDRHDEDHRQPQRFHKMMLRRFREYLLGMKDLSSSKKVSGQAVDSTQMETSTTDDHLSAGLKRKAEWSRGRAPANKRRRTRGGSVTAASSQDMNGRQVADGFALNTALLEKLSLETMPQPLTSTSLLDGSSLEDNFCLLEPDNEVVIQSYSGDDDDYLLEELRPRFIIMFEPDPAFIRRVEVFRASYTHIAIRVYFMIYSNSTEEQVYLSTIRKEKDAFERLVRENANMVIPLEAEHRGSQSTEADISRTVSSRKAGGGMVSAVPQQIIVDHREFRSTLPFMLYSSGLKVIPMTLLVGDYVLSPTICVERKSIPDLIQSLSSGRLYQQCELMVAHYQTPILLIEFSENKSFSLDTTSRSGGHKTYTNSNSNQPARPTESVYTDLESLQSKIVLLTMSFQKLRIIWSSSAHETTLIFQDLKQREEEPDAKTAVAVGEQLESVTRFDPGAENWNQSGQEALLSLPGIDNKNFRYLMEKAVNFQEVCAMSNGGLEDCIGAEQGQKLWKFLNRSIEQPHTHNSA
ncbi:hypothetical protein BT69DRAFT_1311181 [Atractiella rhizophila]|nr:hypothetical protein BT69DRAFT_1311181 [Atractiella rhizophila]